MLIDEIENILYDEIEEVRAFEITKAGDKIIALLAPELEKARRFDNMNKADTLDGFVETFPEIQEWKEKARKWDRVKALSKSDNCEGCTYQNFYDGCSLNDICVFSIVVDALEGETDSR